MYQRSQAWVAQAQGPTLQFNVKKCLLLLFLLLWEDQDQDLLPFTNMATLKSQIICKKSEILKTSILVNI